MSGDAIYQGISQSERVGVKAWNDQDGFPLTRLLFHVDGKAWGAILEPPDRDDLIRMLTEAKEHTG